MEIGFKQLVYIPQLFYMKDSKNELKVLAVKVVDDVLLAAQETDLRNVVEKIRSMYEIGTIVYGPGTFWFNGLSIKQEEDLSISVDADAKLNSIEPYPITRYRRKEVGVDASAIEVSAFRSTNGQLGWIGTAASPLCAHASSSLQQKVPNMKVKAIVDQINYVKTLKKLGTSIKFKKPEKKGAYNLTCAVFSDARLSGNNCRRFFN